MADEKRLLTQAEIDTIGFKPEWWDREAQDLQRSRYAVQIQAGHLLERRNHDVQRLLAHIAALNGEFPEPSTHPSPPAEIDSEARS